MSVNDQTAGPVAASKQRASKLWIAGGIVLALGMTGAGVVYWLGTRAPDFSGDLSLAGYDRPAEQQMAILYGKQGVLIEEWSNDLKQPGTQAFIILAATAFAAGGCFYFARLSDDDGEPANESGAHDG